MTKCFYGFRLVTGGLVWTGYREIWQNKPLLYVVSF